MMESRTTQPVKGRWELSDSGEEPNWDGSTLTPHVHLSVCVCARFSKLTQQPSSEISLASHPHKSLPFFLQ